MVWLKKVLNHLSKGASEFEAVRDTRTEAKVVALSLLKDAGHTLVRFVIYPVKDW